MTWLPVADFPNYAVSDKGSVVYCGRDIFVILQPQSHHGYLRVSLRAPDGRKHWRKIHRLVLEAFVGPRPSPRHHGAHFPDPDTRNNRLTNLRWALPTENEADKRAHGTAPRGGRRLATDPSVVAAIRAEAARGRSFTDIGWFYDLHRSSVARIVRGVRRGKAG
jgi:HNH endonuclease/NUMOD4 motif